MGPCFRRDGARVASALPQTVIPGCGRSPQARNLEIMGARFRVRAGARPGMTMLDNDYGVPIPILFSAASIRCGGSIFIASASPVSSRLLRLERIAGQP